MAGYNDDLPPSYDSVCNYNSIDAKKNTYINKKVVTDQYGIEDNYSTPRQDLWQDPYRNHSYLQQLLHPQRNLYPNQNYYS